MVKNEHMLYNACVLQEEVFFIFNPLSVTNMEDSFIPHGVLELSNAQFHYVAHESLFLF
jgi:hypothetical protein